MRKTYYFIFFFISFFIFLNLSYTLADELTKKVFKETTLNYPVGRLVNQTIVKENIPQLLCEGRYNQAIRAYTLLAQQKDPLAYLNRAIIFKDLGRNRYAIVSLLCGLYLKPNDIQMLRILGRLYYLDNQIEKAIKVLRYVITNAPDVESIVTIGLCYQAIGDSKKAEQYFNAALTLDEKNVLARFSLVKQLLQQKRLEEAAKHLQKLNILDASINSVLKYWAEVVYLLGNDIEAYKLYERLQRIEPENQLARNRLEQLRNKLGRTYFEKERARRTAEKEKKKVLVKPLGLIPKMPVVRIGLFSGLSQLEVQGSAGIIIKARTTKIVIANIPAQKLFYIIAAKKDKIIIQDIAKNTWVSEEPIVLEPAKPQGSISIFDITVGDNEFWQTVTDHSYRGYIEVINKDNKLLVINVLGLEEYLYGVLPAEMPARWPLEALKAQAVAARSETLAKLNRHKNQGYDLCTTVHCQVYNGIESETLTTNLAVEQTKGLVLVYQGKPIDAVYSSNCGGHTQGNIFSNINIPYYQPVSDIMEQVDLVFPLSPIEFEFWIKSPKHRFFCDSSPYVSRSTSRWVRVYSIEEIQKMVSGVKDIGQIQLVKPLKRSLSGHIQHLRIVGSRGIVELEQELKIRNTLGKLRSSMFKIETKYDEKGIPEEFIFYGGGWGHAVGMCQSGACGMAQAGKNFEQILKHYYPFTELRKLY
ncbi:MAG: SpoIID/LytB domain-containing protein [Candidatus Omnitrophica bacterium]|nr:SpoIID/LytB domain-containing protein [Candidatus Omnitrophota bacterium]